jgi:steroid 5-alpha reductase family enzyme
MITLLAVTGASVFVYMTLWFVMSVIRKRNDVADVAWGLGFVVAACTALVTNRGTSPQGIVVLILVTLWGLRLALHISSRNRGKAEDPRYQAWRKEWGGHFYLRSFLQVYVLQGLLLLVISIPVIFLIQAPYHPFSTLDILGAGVWLVGFLFEAVGDYQLRRFKREPSNRGRVMQSGLWRYSRHPNYFGEVVLWWGLYLFTLSVPGGWWTVIGPLTITVLILFVSGIPMLEKRYEGNPEFEDYKRRTSAFLPLPPKEK